MHSIWYFIQEWLSQELMHLMLLLDPKTIYKGWARYLDTAAVDATWC